MSAGNAANADDVALSSWPLDNASCPLRQAPSVGPCALAAMGRMMLSKRGPPMNHDDLHHWSKRAADWAHDYHATLRDRPVRAPLTPGAIAAQLAQHPPEAARTDGDDLCRFRTHRAAGHDPLAAPALLRLFPGQCRARLDAGRTTGQCHGGAWRCCGRPRPPRPRWNR